MKALKGRSFIYDLDFTKEEILFIFKRAKELKRKKLLEKPHSVLKGKSLAMIFQKPSTRTRVSFEVGMYDLGGYALNLSANDLQLSRGETVADTARTLSRYCDGIVARVFSHNDILQLAKHSSVPVINGLSDTFHPCQSYSDLFTLLEKTGSFKNLRLSYIGDGDNNVANSLLLLCARLGVGITIGCPPRYKIKKEIVELAHKEAKKTGANIIITKDPQAAVKKADAIYTDVWLSMGRRDIKNRQKFLKSYQLNSKLLERAKKTTYIMHCLPAHRGEEITDDVIDSKNSLVFDQAENRLHVQKAILSLLM